MEKSVGEEKSYPEGLTWDAIVKEAPALRDLLSTIIEASRCGSVEGAEWNWYHVYKPVMKKHVGFLAPETYQGFMRTCAAYDLVYQKLCEAMEGENG